MADDKNSKEMLEQEIDPTQDDSQSNGNSPKDEKRAEKTFTQEEVNAIVQERVKRAVSKAEEKAKADREEAEKLAKMNAQERMEHENQKLKDELAELRKANTLSQMAKTARGMLSERGVHVEDALVQTLITDKAETTQKNVESFCKMYQKAVEAGINEKLKGKTPNRMSPKGMTRNEILGIKDIGERQRAIAEHLDLFNS